MADRVQDVFDNLFGNFSYENCYKHLTAGRKGSTAIMTVQEHQSHYRAVLFTYIGATRRQNSDDEILRLSLTLSKFMGSDCKPCEPKRSINPSNYESKAKAGGFAIPPIPGSSNSLGVPSVVPSFTAPQKAKAVESPPSTPPPPPPSFLPTGSRLAVTPAATSGAATALPSTSQHGTNDTEDMASYTVLLKEIGDEDGEYGVCAEERVQFEPPWWKCTVKFRGVEGIGEGSKKRTAKHRASKSVYLQLGYSALS